MSKAPCYYFRLLLAPTPTQAERNLASELEQFAQICFQAWGQIALFKVIAWVRGNGDVTVGDAQLIGISAWRTEAAPVVAWRGYGRALAGG